ncbi:MAG TPA: DUF4097 family beta strand repeat-containing protein [Blastocatellia bacterium]|nr:DUF4097 family beta strand repeat-containing protein [Blastocatellia bacterium]
MPHGVSETLASAGRKTGRTKRWGLLLGMLLVGAGVLFFLAPQGAGMVEWLMRLWPLYLVCAGVVRVMGFAIERKPRSPLGGMLMIFIGVLFFAARFHPDLNALQIYGRYWPLLLAVFAAVELVRYYSHRFTEGPPPRLFTFWRLMAVLLIFGTGVVANRAAAKNPSLLSALHLPGFLSEMRDSVIGDAYSFSDPAVVLADVRPGAKIIINNDYGDIKVTGGGAGARATLTKRVRAWNEEDARGIAEKIQLVTEQSAEGLKISTNRNQVEKQFTTDIQLQVPSSVALAITGSYGTVTISGIQGTVDVKTSYGRAEVNRTSGNVNLALTYSDASAADINGNVTVTGAKRARLTDVSGAVSVAASNGAVELRNVSGPVRVNAPFCRVTAEAVGERMEITGEHANIKITRAADVSIAAPHSDVVADTIGGNLRVESSNSKVQARAVEGQFIVTAERSSVTASDVRGPVDVGTSHGEVQIKNFYQGARVRTSYRKVTLIAAGEIAGDIEVENSHGEIKLTLPQTSRFQLDAFSESGMIRPVGFVGLPEKNRENLVAAFGEQGPKVRLRTSYKNITIQANGSRQARAEKLVY